MNFKNCFYAVAASLMFTMPIQADETELAKSMEEMNDAYRALRRTTDGEKGAELARVAQMAVLKGFSTLPEMVMAMPEGAPKAKAAAAYRVMMGKLYTSLAEMEVHFLNGDLEGAQEIVAKMRDMKKDGHDQFMED